MISHSQNFLKSSDLVADLLNKTSISKVDVVYEIGGGERYYYLCHRSFFRTSQRRFYKNYLENSGENLFTGSYKNLLKQQQKLKKIRRTRLDTNWKRKCTQELVPPIRTSNFEVHTRLISTKMAAI